jgi:hypothetical protein
MTDWHPRGPPNLMPSLPLSSNGHFIFHCDHFSLCVCVCVCVCVMALGLNSGLHNHKAGGFPLEPHLQSILLWLFGRWDFAIYLLRLALNHDPPYLSLPSS